ncbi:hypothetical protein [Paenibacillus beijingensis]|uniref:Restriction endonuclease S subunit n=1 Tax=Paenibacillus beijingensis TaxID=1126833 RepID=A0A0D5NEC2_9BACL|nr:hypothetical protein [Paenibacillus beijingensis]AJY73601.1 restriction endonuclease S subunit [Paenibacillus beijingensis]
MSEREQSLVRLLETTALLQWNIAHILDAKALEAEKVRTWIYNHISNDSHPKQQVQLDESVKVHDQIIDIIDGINKLGQGMVSMLKVVLRHEHDSRSMMDGFGGGMMGGGMMGGGMDFGDRP